MVHRVPMYARALALSCALLTIGALATGCRSDAPPAFEKTHLARLPADYVPQTAVISESGTAWAFVRRAGTGERVVSSVGTGEVHGKCVGLAFAPKSDRLFYWTSDGTGAETRIGLVAEGTAMPTDFLATGQLGFSDDGARWFAAGVARGAEPDTLGDITLFVDGAEVARHRDVSMPGFSAAGGHVAFLTATDRRATLVVDGRPGRTFGPPTVSCGTTALASTRNPDLPLRHLAKYLSDGSLLLVTRDADGWGVYVDERRIASYPRSMLDAAPPECQTMPSMAPRSLRTATEAPAAVWWKRTAGDVEAWRVVRNGEPVDDVVCAENWRTHPPEPGRDGRRVVYPCITKDPSGVPQVHLIDGPARYGPYVGVWGIARTTNDAHVAYGAEQATGDRPWAVYVDGVRRAGPFASVWRPRVSDDGAVVAWEATREKGGRGIFGIDDRPVGSFDEILWGPELEPERVAWIVRRGRKITRITVPLAFTR